jgi:D-proline reductase (dithiol) PrdB
MGVERMDTSRVEAEWAAWEAWPWPPPAACTGAAQNRSTWPLTPGDDSARWIPGDVETKDLRFAHDHYDHTDLDRDPNCMFPLDRLRELAADGVVGSVARWHVGFMGWIPDPHRFARETVPQMVERLSGDHVDVVVLSPG